MTDARTKREYILGTDAEELFRLGFQHQLWLEQATSAWNRAGFKLGDSLLDVGCGPGFAAFDLAQRVGKGGRVVAVDQSERFIGHLQEQAHARGLPQIAAVVGDVARLGVEPSAFDGAYARWVLCFVPDPKAVIRGVARALRPGRCFVIQDYFRYEGVTIAPRDPIFEKVFRAVAESWRRTGGNPDVGCELPDWLLAAGFELRAMNMLSRLAQPGTPLWQWPDTFFPRYLTKLTELKLITARDAREYQAKWRKRGQDPGALFVTPPMIEIIAVKKGGD